MQQEVVAGLLDHVVQAHEGGVIIPKGLLQNLNGLGDLLSVFARWPLALLRTNKAFREDGLDQSKDLLAARLGPQNATSGFTDHPRNWRSPCVSGETVMATTCFQAGPLRCPMNSSSRGHRRESSALTTARLASSKRKASACASSGSLTS